MFIFDAGTGIINLGNHILGDKKKHKFNVCISHPHWDHIQGFPFFKPAFMQGNEIAVFGSSHGDISLREVVSKQMESIYFPITMREFAARVYFKELREGKQWVDGLSMSTMLLNHPGNTLGYKLADNSGKAVAYITDNELTPSETGGMDPFYRDKLVAFLKGVDLLVHDVTYFDDEYKTRMGWGHSPISETLRLAIDAGVKAICLFHHDPAHNDAKVDEKEAFAIKYLKEHGSNINVFAAREGTTVRI
jgi:phosphoribosyl 1,2-cyclic phosphodiesterase